MIHLLSDFKEFLQLLNDHHFEYLLVGGYAVGYYGYPRATGDIDFWLAVHPDNAAKIVDVLNAFGFGAAGATTDLFCNTIKSFKWASRQYESISSPHFLA